MAPVSPKTIAELGTSKASRTGTWILGTVPGQVASADSEGDSVAMLGQTAERRALESFVQRGGTVIILPSARLRAADWPWWDRLVGVRPTPMRIWGDDNQPLASKAMYDGGRVVRVSDPESIDEGAGQAKAEGTSEFAMPLDSAISSRRALQWVSSEAREQLVGDPAQANRELAMPADGSFAVQDLAGNLNDPMELDVAANGDVYVIEREGRLVRLVAAEGYRQEVVTALSVAGGMPGGTVAQECGGLGLTLSPDFMETGHIFVFYSPPAPSVHRLSRFTIKLGSAPTSLGDERTLLEIPTDRENTTCHEGGSLAFGPDGNLYLSVGDNTNPFESNGYAPIDEREGRKWWDAQRSAGNANDLRGGIVRIRPTAEGGYKIPAGNLFPPGTPNTRPELYVKGCRNPFRMSIDPLTGDIYWGDVGPDASVDGSAGTRGFDEFNRATSAGFFGWPYYRGGLPYLDRDFETDVIGPSFDELLVNDSPNNTGIRNLPPAVPPYFSYTYAEDERLPELRSGSRNAMAGPIFRGPYDESAGGFPAYFDGKPIFYDWARGHIFVCAPDEAGNLGTMHRFLEDLTLKHPMDTAIGPNGELFVLEYGTDWYFNTDGRVRRITFTGHNQAPEVSLQATPGDGLTPLEVTLKATVADADDADESLQFTWDLGDAEVLSEAFDSTKSKQVTLRLETAGLFRPSVTVTDSAGNATTAEASVVVGNQRPRLGIELASPGESVAWGDLISMAVTVEDLQHESVSAERQLTDFWDNLEVWATYYPLGAPEVDRKEHPVLTGLAQDDPGAQAMVEYGCTACHSTNRTSVGPSYQQVASRFAVAEDQAEERRRLAAKIVQGGQGIYGVVPMPPQLHVPPVALERILDSIASLAPTDGKFSVWETAGGGQELVILDDSPELPTDGHYLQRSAVQLPTLQESGTPVGGGEILLRARYEDGGVLLAGMDSAQLPLVGTARLVIPAPRYHWPVANNKTTIPATGAQIHGSGARMEAANVGYYSDPKTTLSWSLDIAEAGTYEVRLAIACPADQAGSTFTLHFAGAEFSGTVPATDGWQSYTVLSLGEVAIPTTGTYGIEFAPDKLAKSAVGNIGDMTLIRTGD
ncbi:MAG: cytochrome c [Planctomycetota bacterium]|jgi:cytochrome c